MTTRRLDDSLSIRGGRLFVEERDATQLLEEFGSPLFVVSEDQLRRNVRRFQAAFAAGWPDGRVRVMPAAKANWVTAVQCVLADEGCGADVYSAGELSVALAAGFEPATISVNGVPKSEEHVRRTVEVGARLTVDSVGGGGRPRARAARDGPAGARGAPAATRRVRLRRPQRLRLRGPRADGLVALVYKGGLSTEEAIPVGRRLLAMPGVELVGLHQHHGRHHPSTRYWEEQMKSFAAEAGRVCGALGGWRPRELDIGGGFAVPRDPFNAATDYTAPFQLGILFGLSKLAAWLGAERRYRLLAPLVARIEGRPRQAPAPSIEDYAEACTRTLLARSFRGTASTRAASSSSSSPAGASTGTRGSTSRPCGR